MENILEIAAANQQRARQAASSPVSRMTSRAPNRTS